MAPGDLVAYDPYTLHAAYGSTESGRLSLLFEPTESEGGTR
jgi:ectoine hydroxylase-related dioxygenase (phytanoyl-CoA dioxygenase family)